MKMAKLSIPAIWLLAVAGCMGTAEKYERKSAPSARAAKEKAAPAGERGAPPATKSEPAVAEGTSRYEFADEAVRGELVRPEGEEIAGGAKRAPRPGRPAPSRRPSSPGVKAGAADDNQQFGAFLEFLEKNGNLGLKCNVSERVIVEVVDADGRPIPDAVVEVRDGNETLLKRKTYADGRCLVFSSEDERLSSQSARLVVTAGSKTKTAMLNTGRHRVRFRFDFRRKLPRPVPLDIAFVLDTTGSMGDEIQKLKQTIEYINFQITHFEPRPDVRFGMVLYRDRGDDYRTRVVPFTGDFSKFVEVLSSVRAGGGGDTPEDVQEALRQAMWSLKWRTSGVKLAFLIGDAPPHLDYGQQTTYVDSMRRAAELGVKIAAIGASGLDLQGELVWRQIAQYTMAPFVFLTYGETGDSEGSPSTVSHHVGNNWVAENLDAIIVRMVKIELSHYGERPVVAGEDYFTADASSSQAAGQVLEELFRQAVRQLIDYCVQRIDPSTPTVVLPPVAAKEVSSLAAKAGRKLLDRLSLGLVQSGRFQLVEKADQPKVLEQLKEQFGSKYDEAKVAELGKLVPAKLAVFSRLDPGEKGRVEMLIKLVRLETGEILSLSLLKIDRKLLGQ